MERTAKKILAVTAALLLSEAGTPWAAFQEPAYAVRAEGMGRAFAAVADDANALLLNPAGAARAAERQLFFSHSKPYQSLDLGISNNHAAALLPVKDLGALGLSYSRLSAPVYTQTSYSLTAASSFNRWFPDLQPKLTAGLSVRYLGHAYGMDDRTRADPVFDANGRSAHGTAVDAGLWMEPEPGLLPGLSLAAVGKSLNEPDLGLATPDRVHRTWTLGAGYTRGRWTAAADLSRRNGRNSWGAGTELWLGRKLFALRAGVHSTAATAGCSWRQKLKETRGFFIDYSFSLPYNIDNSGGTHQAAFGIYF